ncbi:MAG TPA: hypothetical protein VN634_11400 [Candidatus Limnocylindrales bacterium]|nr:hypothetical protein [Candidatus Limnocylindrales bacterium]
MLLHAFAGEHQLVVFDLDLDLVLVHSRNFGSHDELATTLEHFDGRDPVRGSELLATLTLRGTPSRLFDEQLIEIFHEPSHEGERVKRKRKCTGSAFKSHNAAPAFTRPCHFAASLLLTGLLLISAVPCLSHRFILLLECCSIFFLTTDRQRRS